MQICCTTASSARKWPDIISPDACSKPSRMFAIPSNMLNRDTARCTTRWDSMTFQTAPQPGMHCKRAVSAQYSTVPHRLMKNACTHEAVVRYACGLTAPIPDRACRVYAFAARAAADLGGLSAHRQQRYKHVATPTLHARGWLCPLLAMMLAVA